MNRPVAASRTSPAASVAIPGRRLANKIRFVVGLSVSVGGAGVLLSDVMRLFASLG